MKYGETLRQRSIPQWGHHNVDYDDIKHLIKEHTTPGSGKAVAIPGQGDEDAQAFEDELFSLLLEQHDRINLFIKSKSGEIERRLEHINKRILELQSRHPISQDTRLPAKLVERYAKFDADVSKAGEEVRSLSRFRAAQRTAFTKLLKKYKKWTRSSELGLRFRAEVTDKPDSFCQLDLGYLLDLYTDVLHSVRAPFEVSTYSKPHIVPPNNLTALSASVSPRGSVSSSTASQIFNAIEESSEVGYDTTLATVPIGAGGSKATYWIHPDHIVEVQVFLLQYMRLYNSGKAKNTAQSSANPTPLRRNSSFRSDNAGNFGKEDDIGIIVLDHPDEFAKKQNASPIGDSEEVTGRYLTKAAGSARWTSSGEAIVMVGLDSKKGAPDSRLAKLKRKYVDAFLNTATPFTSRRPSYSSVSSEIGEQDVDAAAKATESVREWLNAHKDVAPLAEITSKRTRFIGLGNNTFGGLWATLDREISMKKYVPGELADNDWLQKARTDSHSFPHAVLEVRREGTQSAEIIKALDRVHLTERVRGFSLEVHAVWACSKPNALSPPLWIPTLATDIRKLPDAVKKQRRSATTVGFSAPLISQPTSRSTTSATDGQTSPSTIHNLESSATSGPEYLETPTLSSFKTKRRSYGTIIPEEPSGQPEDRQNYWNEYDHPEDGSEDEAYFIYIDPNSTVHFPGQDTLLKWAHKTQRLFRLGKRPEETSLLQPHSPISPTSDGDDDESSSDEAVRAARIGQSQAVSQDSTEGQGFFSSLFGSRPASRRQQSQIARRQSAHEIHTLMELIEARQHDREMTKLRLYATCLVASVVIDIILGTLIVTGRRKERGVVDAGILFGTIANLLLLIVAVASMRTRHERLGWFHQTVLFSVVVAVVVVDVLLLRWVLA
ncbi:uncharacterized protein BDZ99DRAFT_417899 [Mytilinidion resinicola]|uniref:SPX domain-containing protein n=1 Tax=Mytilinidion resinicola TaxID=574789 RepID=A0A6A6YP04_9PEZI|nr:uncharacterized protein BDZ99DRAFT_417899 [Mytilinidion resinicola]KAF2809744.1 hypothetical protein BDZ99DRAFT_417899 [Mytilinidion resinicola]